MARPATRPALPRESLHYAPSLGSELRRFREAHRLTQDEAAQKAGVSQRVLSRWENNRVADLDARTLIRLGHVYGLTPNAVAQMAGWWHPAQPSDISDPRWDYILEFLGNPKIPNAAKRRLIELAYASCRVVESLQETGGLERIPAAS